MVDLEQRLNYQFSEPGLLVEALSHPSLSSEKRPAPPDNQRLEYLGDAVIELVITNHLFHRFSDLKEGLLTKLRASLVSRPTLARAAGRVYLGEALHLSNGEASSGGRERSSNLADAFEAVMGAVYLDGGLTAATDVVLQLLAPELKDLKLDTTQGNFKGELQEALQKITPESPHYTVTDQDGPPHQRTFTVAVIWQQTTLGTGKGPSKKKAESDAARNALQTRIWENTPSSSTSSQT